MAVRDRRRVLLAPVVALVAVGVAGCGGGEAPSRPPRVDSLPMTRNLAPEVRSACRDAARDATIRVVCPPYVPDVPFASYGDPEVDRGLRGAFAAPPGELYELTFNNGDNRGTTHWMAGAGKPAVVRRDILSDEFNETKGLPLRVRRIELDGRRVDVYRYRGRAGGMHSGHVIAVAHMGELWALGSVHGFRHEDAAVAMAVTIAEEYESR